MDDTILKHFRSKLSVAPCDLAQCSIGDSASAGVLSPSSATEVSEAMRVAAAHKLALVPCGGMTSQGRGAPPPPGFLALKSSNFNSLIHHEPGDMVATVQSGMRVSDFQDQLRARGQWLPIDAPMGSTIGGIIASNVYGPRSHGYGTLRDQVLGMTVINGDGILRKTGSKVVKSVTGYALEKLYIGSGGTLCFIVDVTFKLRPLLDQWPIFSGTVHLAFRSARGGARDRRIESAARNLAACRSGTIGFGAADAFCCGGGN